MLVKQIRGAALVLLSLATIIAVAPPGDASTASAASTDRAAGPRVDWTMPPRYGKPSADGLVRPSTVADATPDSFKATIRLKRPGGKACKAKDQVKLAKVAGAISLTKKKRCVYVLRVAEEGTYPATFRLRYRSNGKIKVGTTKTDIVINDLLVVGIGDSNASGEGTPDVDATFFPPSSAKWGNEKCHRSAKSHQAVAARSLEDADKRTSVTFVHLACSGARITDGLVLGYDGIEPDGEKLPPQLAELAAVAEARSIDAVVVSIGANDINFSGLVAACLTSSCVPDLQTPTDAALAELPGRYAAVASALTAAGVAPETVFVGEYFDPTRDDAGSTCDPLIDGPGPFDITQSEAAWAFDNVVVPLNQAVSTAASAHGWTFVGGAQASFAEHGYCAEDTWIVQISASLLGQLDADGTLHANQQGNVEQAALLASLLAAQLTPLAP